MGFKIYRNIYWELCRKYKIARLKPVIFKLTLCENSPLHISEVHVLADTRLCCADFVAAGPVPTHSRTVREGGRHCAARLLRQRRLVVLERGDRGTRTEQQNTRLNNQTRVGARWRSA